MKSETLNSEDKKSFKLAIYLLKETISKYRDALKEDAEFKEYDFNDKIYIEGKVIIGKTKQNEPNWKEFIQEGVKEELPDLNNTSNRAIIFFSIQKRIFAIPFGYGKHLIKEESIDREFGLKTALNIINADKLLSIDKANIGDLSVLTKTQASQKGTPDYFNIDILKDLIRSITGEPNVTLSKEFGNAITGNEGVYISPKTNILEIPNILSKLNIEYKKDTYKKRFDWIDNIKTERDPAIIEALKGNLIKDLRNKNFTSVHLAPPFIIKWENFEGLYFTPKGNPFYDFDIENFFSSKDINIEELDWERLIRYKLYIKERLYDEPTSFNLWRFINYETEYLDNKYVFTLSNWYHVNKDYYKTIYDYCCKIEESKTIFLDCRVKEDEGKYNLSLSSSNPNFICLDKKLIRSDLSRSEIEACDVFTKEKEFIHIKFRDSSSTLSHLFAQGRVSCNSLRRDRTFRKNLRLKIKLLGLDIKLIPLENKDFNPNDFTITYAIIEKKDRKFVDALPFFSLINFRMAAEDLMVMGFNLRVKKILIK